MAKDPFDLQRFVTAQGLTFETALAELRAGCKRTHWTWFIFPQLRGLGRLSTAQFCRIASLDEACVYLAHPLWAAPRVDHARSTRRGLSVQVIWIWKGVSKLR